MCYKTGQVYLLTTQEKYFARTVFMTLSAIAALPGLPKMLFLDLSEKFARITLKKSIHVRLKEDLWQSGRSREGVLIRQDKDACRFINITGPLLEY